MEIVKIPDKILAKKLQSISPNDIKNGNYTKLIDQMRQVMVKAKGVGLAANQIGQDLSIFVIDQELAKENKVPDAFINPEVSEYSKDHDEMEEGCLSLPGVYLNLKRSKKVKIKAIDEGGHKIRLKARGFLARVLQHEMDHLNGLTIKDHA